MCFHVQKGQPVRKAKKNITVYKLLFEGYNKKLLAPYNKGFQYKLNRTASVEKSFWLKTKQRAKTGRTYAVWNDIIVDLFYGLHSYRTKARAYGNRCSMSWILYKAVIPKGAEYYVNATQRISNKLKIIGRV